MEEYIALKTNANSLLNQRKPVKAIGIYKEILQKMEESEQNQ